MREQCHARIATVALNQMEELYIPHKYVMQNIPGLCYMDSTLHIGTINCELDITTTQREQVG